MFHLKTAWISSWIFFYILSFCSYSVFFFHSFPKVGCSPGLYSWFLSVSLCLFSLRLFSSVGFNYCQSTALSTENKAWLLVTKFFYYIDINYTFRMWIIKQKSDRKHLVYYVSLLFSFTEDFHVLKERVVIENPQWRDNFVLCFDWAEIFIYLDCKLKSSSSDQQLFIQECSTSLNTEQKIFVFEISWR